MDNTVHAIFGITSQPGAIFLTLLRLLFYSKNPILDAELATPCGHSFCGFCVDMFKKSIFAPVSLKFAFVSNEPFRWPFC